MSDFEAHDIAGQAGVTALPGGSAAVARARLRAAALPTPRLPITADDVADGKPNPAAYQLGAELLRLPTAVCLAVEDAPQGLLSATRAGCRTLALLTTHAAHQLRGATVTAHDLAAARLRYDPV
jgi:sugar-phosphatase